MSNIVKDLRYHANELGALMSGAADKIEWLDNLVETYRADNKQLREALQFYADADMNALTLDNGLKACAVLAQRRYEGRDK